MSATDPIAGFKQVFKGDPSHMAYAPGRINLIGEHIDYNGGCVLPFAIPQRVAIAAVANDSGVITAHSAALDQTAAIPVGVSAPSTPAGWANYVEGMICQMRELGVKLTGARLWIGGDLDPGCGMSSSAALCSATGFALAALAGAEIAPLEIALAGQRTEHRFANMPCGIMDQYASCFGREDHALLIDCNALTHEYVPIAAHDWCVLAIPSGVKHALVEGAYEKRVTSCRQAVEVIGKRYPKVISLHQVDGAMLAACQDDLDDETYRRARHVVSEIARVDAAVAALKSGDLAALGDLINQTQDSLRDDYEVSCPEIDDLCALLRDQPGVLGARMVGGGFGGVVIALTALDRVADVEACVQEKYYDARGLGERMFRVRPSAGASAQPA